MADRAGLDVGIVDSPFAVAVRTRLIPFDGHLLVAACCNLFESKTHAGAYVAAAVHPLALRRPAGRTPAEAPETAEPSSEEVVEDVVDVAESSAEVKSSRIVAETSESELVILALLVGVAQDRIRLGSFLELLLRGLLLLFRTVDPTVGMPLQGKLPVSGFYIVSRGVPSDAQHLVIISFVSHKLHSHNYFSKP